METAVHVDRLSRHVRQTAVNKCKNGFCYILRLAPTLDRQKAAVDERIILALDGCRHAGCDNARTNLVYRNAVFGKAVSKETKVDLLVTPAVTIIVGVALAKLIAPPIGKAASAFGILIDHATKLQPFWMGIVVSVLVGIALTLPISSAAICSVLQLTGLAGGAAVAGCCAQMIGFAVMSFRENRWGGLVSQGIGTSMLQMPNIVRNPRIWIAPIVTSAITGPIATCLFKLQMNGAPINSGMGTCGLCGQIGVWTGWVAPSEEAIAKGAAAIVPGAMDWIGLVLISFILPAVLCPLINMLCRRLGWVKDGDMKLS